MKYLLESGEFKSKKDLKYIAGRIVSNKYVSKTNAKELERISGVNGIVDKMYKRVDHLIDFFESSSVDFMDDVLYEFFEGSEYTYTVKLGCHTYASGMGDSYFIIDERYEENEDKQGYLLSELMMFVANLNELSAKKVSERGKNKRGTFRISYLYTPHNYFKSFLKIKPLIVVEIKHKEFSNVFHMDHNTLKGWDHNEVYGYESLSKKIKKRFDSTDVFGPCTITSNYYNDRYTSSHYYNDEGVITKRDRNVIITSNMYIKLN